MNNDLINQWDERELEYTKWTQYRFPNNIIIETCCALGEEVEFHKGYSKSYFIDDDVDDIIQPDSIEKTRRWVEEQIYNDCRKSDWKAKDIFRILAWKTGKINYNKTGETGPIIEYDKNWKESDKEDCFVSLQIPYQRKVEWNEFEPIAKEIKDIKKNYCKSKDVQSAWSELLNLSNDSTYKELMRGIGTVYLITLLHFITNNEYPIFDRFAMASLVAWKLKCVEKDRIVITDETIVRGCSLPSKDTKAAQNILKKGIYSDYIELLKEFCKTYYNNEDEWKTNRDVDRALWVHGHFFNVIE